MKIINILFVLFCFILLGCKKENTNLKVEQVLKNENDIVLRYSDKRKQFWSIQFPLKFEITNSSSNKKKFLSCNYIYNNQIGNNSSLFTIKENGKLLRLSSSEIKKIKPGQKTYYLIYSQHIIDTSSYNRAFFKPYLEELKNKNQDTLAVGTLEAFKQKHPEFLKSLLEGDSLNLQFLSPNSKFEKPIKIPVTW